jgi:hypothetical protein
VTSTRLQKGTHQKASHGQNSLIKSLRVLFRLSRSQTGSGPSQNSTGGGTRTPNLRIWNPLLCQLSYARRTRSSEQLQSDLTTSSEIPCAAYASATSGNISSAPAVQSLEFL